MSEQIQRTKATITRESIVDVQVCVPRVWTDEEVVAFLTKERPGPEWRIRRKREWAQRDDPTRVPCSDHEENCHIVLTIFPEIH